MSLRKFGKHLKRELQANPKKAGILGLLLVVAAVFWAPLVLKSDGESAKPLPSPQAAMAPPQSDQAAATGGSGESAPAGPSAWQQWADAIAADPRMHSAPLPSHITSDHNPFWRRSLEVESTDPLEAVASRTHEVVELTPAQLGLTVTSTVVGPHRRAALVNGRLYSEGAIISVGDATGFTVSRVEPGRVVLKRGEERFDLAIARPEASPGQLLRSAP